MQSTETKARREAADRLMDAGQAAEALPLYQDLARDGPGDGEFYRRLGVCLQFAGRKDEALAAYAEAGRRDIAFNAFIDVGKRVLSLAGTGAAIGWFERAIEAQPNDPNGHAGLARAQGLAGRHHVAIAAAERALALDPGHREAWLIRAISLEAIDAMEAASASIETYLRTWPDDVTALVLAGRTALVLGKREAGRAHLDKARALLPDFLPLHLTIARTLSNSEDDETARVAWDDLLARFPGNDHVLFQAAYRRMMSCDWRNYDALGREIAARLDAAIATGAVDSDTLWLLSARGFGYDATMKVARHLARRYVLAPERRLAPKPRDERPRLRVGFLQAMTTFHSTQAAIRDIARRLDRGRFEVHGYARHERRRDPDAFQLSFRQAFDRFADLTDLDDRAAAEAIQRDGVDVLIETQGLNSLNNMGVLAHRPAPVIAHYFGFSHGTSGPFIDYCLVDRTYMPPELGTHMTEAPVFLPGCHLAPVIGEIGPNPGRLGDHGLPETGFVFCNFNHPWKFEPATFAAWMRILAAVPGSVLWLLDWKAGASAALRERAREAGIDPARLVFAPLAKHAEHLARVGHADLALNGFAIGGGVTNFDTLWAGVPLIVLKGGREALWSRLGESMLTALGFNDLIAADPAA
ncbi:MAG: tetratricopeptide repeat protein, partial [Alphaproteobacteria bacterium]|nr:tetratricopeptide repeat protein [Alphaproteobacteria bacterium]